MCRNAFRFIGAVIALMNLVGIILYFNKMVFPSFELYKTYLVFLLVRVLIIASVVALIILRDFWSNKREPSPPELQRSTPLNYQFVALAPQDVLHYSCLVFVLYFGSFRFYAFRDYPLLVLFGHTMELVFQNIPILFI
jgi:hypothetical protein